MNDLKTSDSAIVAMNPANKGHLRSAESGERRAEPKGKPGSQSLRRAQKRESKTQAADRLRQAAKRNPEERLVALLHPITVDALASAFHSLKREAAVGVDGVTWAMYAEGLEDRLIDLHVQRVNQHETRASIRMRRGKAPARNGGRA